MVRIRLERDLGARLRIDRLTSRAGVCTDVPAGASVAFEIYALPGGKPYGTTRFLDVQPGTTDACLRQNPSQLRPSSMAALASSLSSASPELFTGYS